VSEQTSHREDADKQGSSEPEEKDSGGTSADRAKEREREMEEGGEESPA
jgi:hypothetical protein